MSKLDYCFSNDYMVLRPDRAGPVELLHLLFSPKVGRNRAVDCFTSTEIRSFSRRLAIFLNLLLQIVLLALTGPLAALGGAVEFVLNLVDNILHGRMEYPDKSSPTYRSMTGLIDRRVDLDRSIKPTDNRYDAALCVMASKLAYENEAFIQNVVTRHWQMEFVRFYNCWNEFQNAYTAQAFVFCDKPVDADLIVVAFRGTRPFDAARWCADLDPSWYKIPRLGRARAAYTHALGAQRNIGWPKWVEHIKGKPQKVFAYYMIRDAVKELLEANKKARLLVTGHGSGGALAVLFPAILAYHKEKAVLDRLAGVYTFGQPRVGDAMLAMFIERNLDRPKKRHFRITYGDDPLPRLPNESSAVHFLHFGLGLHFDKCYKLKVLRDIPGEPTSSSPLDFVTSRINSAWELGRSVHLGYRRGAYFREGWLLLLVRILALALPGLPFHRVQDYVNAIVLGAYIPKDN
ncbi:triacylglycerol lipase OBL1-like [Phragmites australis]|uniref:triacylglycerol lipase OBL1-like n=1 Tax=Phragmites australis TaxID=29695 RepID=UPI002D784202|nr:triacylglycerol lipase OBL1-like [Phragmites australis]